MPGNLAAAIYTTSEIFKAPFPDGKTKLWSFLGACNVYRRFIKDFSSRYRPLNTILNKGVELDWGKPSEEQKNAFQDLRDSLNIPSVLSLPKIGRPFILDTDASRYKIGVTLLQQQNK